jgi:two-component system sensor histidine kinase KdpD
MLCFNFFFLPPTGAFTVQDPQNWVALAAFLVTAVVASQLSAGIRKRATEAIQRRSEMEKLYTLSRGMMLAETGAEVAKQVARLIADTFESRAVMIYDRAHRSLHRAGPEDSPITETRLQDVVLQDTPFHDSATKTFLLPIRLGGEPLGALAISGSEISDTALNSIANLAAIALERARSLEAASRAEAARQSEELKSTLLDALAHELKTPLTSIKAAATGLLTDASLKGPQVELLTVIDEEADRLNSMVTDAIRMARIEAGDVRLEKRPSEVSELVEGTVRGLRGALEGRAVTIDVPPGMPRLAADRELISAVIGLLLENALKYSPAGTPMAVSARADGPGVVITVSDSGPGIAPEDRQRIFDRFYRGNAAGNQAAGTGMGLAIASEVVKLHGGRIWVEDSPEPGARISFFLPAAVEGAA